MRITNLDMDVLRTFVTGTELGSFAKAAQRLGRSQSAVSLQLKKLEEQVGEALLRKEGRGLALTAPGEILFSYARRLLELNDEAVAATRGIALEGWVRLGLVQDFAQHWLPALLGRFARAHPGIKVDVVVDRGVLLAEQVAKGELDLALAWGDYPSPYRRRLAEIPLCWVGRADFRVTAGEPVPLIVFRPPCTFRTRAIAALDAAGLAWRIAFNSPSLAGLFAAVEAGLGVTPRTAEGLPQQLVVLGRDSGLPAMAPPVELFLHAAQERGAPAVERLKETLLETLRSDLASARFQD
ncbi:DNA-binding transcriptional LysR family regulator [Dongia mobilis]|uniref:DNA-binding transcriptional LysR family regulator n=1 Tax=Dongia mobilis TaxID=578943 RepID=A0A4R6WMQ9_9PROT|nr:LysR substrate-binding domain-containing protein [Dongia mobilis]TDQ82309.1 DNA-binding transcriptional LysR family regulator [Dongia mobilis]